MCPRLWIAQGTALSRPYSPNDLWCADYKGEFMLADRRYCYPLTISDFASRYLISCEALASTKATVGWRPSAIRFRDTGHSLRLRLVIADISSDGW